MRAFLALTLMLCSACIRPAMELRGGLSPRPAPTEAVWWGSGFLLDEGLQLAKVKAPYRIPIVFVSAWAVRNVCAGPDCRYFGRVVDSGFLFASSVTVTELANCWRRLFTSHGKRCL